MLKTSELLLPVGSPEKMCATYAYGADTIYAGQPGYPMPGSQQ